MKKIILTVLMVLCLVALCACQGGEQERFDVVTSKDQLATQRPAAQAQTVVGDPGYDFDTGDYDPASEENWDEASSPVTVYEQAPETNQAPEAASAYPGATPVVLDPIDKPTPTPAPAISITEYQVYDATRLRLSFEGPVGWTIDDTRTDSYTITNPDSRASYPAQLTVTTKAVAAEYTQNDLKKEVKTQLNTLKADYTGFSPTNTATRTLFDKTGVYADFSGVLKDTDVKVWGRVHAITVNKTLVVLTITAPYEYRETYKDTLYSKFRHTVKFTK